LVSGALNNLIGRFKNFEAEIDTINGIEAYAMLRKGQSSLATNNGREVSIADQYYKIAA
jgi:hypothetical protein